MKSETRNRMIELLLAFLLPTAVFLLILSRYHIVPFGESTLLFSDLDTQYVEFMAEYRRVLSGNGSFSWSWNAGLGMNFLGLIAYYLASPFNFLLILFPENQLPLAVTVLTTLKLACSGCALALFLQKHNGSKGILVPLFSACYALSAYAIGYAFNIMWLDAMIWLPLLCSGIDKLLESNQKGMVSLTFLLALSFLSQFYMAYMTGFFCAIYFFSQVVIRRTSFRNLIRDAIRFGICTGIAAGLSAFLLLPTFFVLKNNMGLIGQEFPSPGINFPFDKLIPKLFIGSFDGIKDCLPHIYCGLPAIPGVILFFTAKQISLREKAVSGMILFLLTVSFWFAPFNFLWHAMDHPSWFPYRYAFIFCFWFVSLACRGFSKWEFRDKKLISIYAASAAVMIAAVFIFDGDTVPFLIINVGFLTGYLLISLIERKAIRDGLLLAAVSAELMTAGSLIISGRINSYTKLDDYVSFHAQYHQLTESVMPEENDFYRMEKAEYRNYNDALGIGYPGLSHFSSTASTRQSEFLKRLGFNCYATWCSYEGSTAATDAFLSIRYEFWKNGKQNSKPAGENTWEHPAVFPLFFFAEETFARYDFFTDVDAITRQNDLLKLLDPATQSDFFEPIPVKIDKIENLKFIENGVFLKINPDSDAFLELEIDTIKDRSVYLFFPGASLSHTVTINGTDEVMNGNRDYAPFPICLDAYSNNKPIRIRIDAVKEKLSGRIEAYALDTKLLEALSDKINAAAPLMEKQGPTTFSLKTDNAQEDRLVVSSIPFDAGWQVQSNGEKLPLKMIHKSTLGFILPAGCDEVTVSYRAYGAKEGLAMSGAALLLWIGLIWFERIYSRRSTRGRL